MRPARAAGKATAAGDGVRLLDLFCGAGGAGMGYSRAGFEVVGVDNRPMPRYPFAFVQGDALVYLSAHWREFDAIHASPPCQDYSSLHARYPDRVYPDLVAPTRDALQATGLPFVIENVMPAPLTHGITLCGGMFGLRTYRHRRFESSVFMFQPEHPPHVIKTSTKKRITDFNAGMHISVTGDIGTTIGRQVMQIDWMNGNELSQAIPPAYTEYIGRHLLAALEPA